MAIAIMIEAQILKASSFRQYVVVSILCNSLFADKDEGEEDIVEVVTFVMSMLAC